MKTNKLKALEARLERLKIKIQEEANRFELL